MGRTRVCGKRCHRAVTATCRCWCGGVFHGVAGRLARETFKAEFRLDVPTTQERFEALVG